MPSAITDTIPVYADNVADTIVKDELLDGAGHLHEQYAQACKEAGIE